MRLMRQCYAHYNVEVCETIYKVDNLWYKLVSWSKFISDTQDWHQRKWQTMLKTRMTRTWTYEKPVLGNGPLIQTNVPAGEVVNHSSMKRNSIHKQTNISSHMFVCYIHCLFHYHIGQGMEKFTVRLIAMVAVKNHESYCRCRLDKQSVNVIHVNGFVAEIISFIVNQSMLRWQPKNLL